MLQKRMNEVAQPEKPSASQPVYSKMERFLQLDSKVLRFNAIWDDRNAIFGDLHELIVCYYLVDDTIQINSVKTSKKFLNRQRLPKHFDGFPMLGEVTNLKVLNVLGGGFLTGRYIADRQGVEGKQIECVTVSLLLCSGTCHSFISLRRFLGQRLEYRQNIGRLWSKRVDC